MRESQPASRDCANRPSEGSLCHPTEASGRRRKEDCSTSPAGQHKGAASLTGEMAVRNTGRSAQGTCGGMAGGHRDPDTCRGAQGTYEGTAGGHRDPDTCRG
ncbi:MAG: hypothetical protein ACK55I_44320, partial [bacterium]